MNIPHLKQTAAARLEQAQQEKKIVLIYSGLAIGSAVLVTAVNYLLGLQISQSGGLGNMGTRAMLSSLQTMLPLIQSVALMCLDVGYIAAMLRIARGQYASPQTLRLGFDRLWVLLRCSLIQGMLYGGLAFGSIYATTFVYMMSPMSASLMEILLPVVSEASVINPNIVLDEAVYQQLTQAITPVLILSAVVFLALSVPLFYRYRLANYLIIDRPAIGAVAALRESRNIMRGNKRALAKLDLSFWWFYLASFGATALGNADSWLSRLGVQLPFSGEVGYYIFLVLYWSATFAIYFFLRNRVEVAYGLAYDTFRPKEQSSGGVVLGNIFQM